MKKNERGITLIALVITVIVLLILAGVSISMIVGENGVLNKAKNAKQNTQRAEIVEQARLDVSDKQVNNLDSKLKKSELIEVLNDYFENVPENSDDILSETVIAKQEYGGYSIKVNEIYNNGFLDEDGTPDLPDPGCICDLSISINPSISFPSIGEEFCYTIKISNEGYEGVKVHVSDTLPDYLEFIHAGDGGTFDTANRVVTWDEVFVPGKGSKELKVWVKSSSTGDIKNEAIMNFANESASASTIITVQ